MTDREKYPELFLPDANIDRRTCGRIMPMEVLSLGLSRTGTTSLRQALMILGHSEVYHGFRQFNNVSECAFWVEGFKAKYDPASGRKPFGREEFDQLLGHCSAACDTPANAFGPELIAAYPDAKVILVDRDISSWMRSFEDTIIKWFFENRLLRLLSFLRAPQVAEIDDMMIAWLKYVFKASNREEFRENARAVYIDHYKTIREVTPPERLLNFRLVQGWEPLCEFLGKPVPDVPFPHSNDTQAYHDQLEVVTRRATSLMLRRAAPVLVGVAFAVGAVLFKYRVNKL
ncbi:hypothetical protein J7T55_001004 [Diaporthe amygdali]|uniref:uncharacterized protein n=1 Tax=Phomopsis amygdali TaxID=1214568 RepID=UPI0022FDC633|nr:uncharacterized protein J7T55_001004 [Diaporthe amygdali]KAJ0120149.1 hypothetical protein J7T55_001004 [Diaporthe amygdali]